MDVVWLEIVGLKQPGNGGAALKVMLFVLDVDAHDRAGMTVCSCDLTYMYIGI